MSKSQRLESILAQAKRKEKTYDWLGAAELYEQALNMAVKMEFLTKGDIQERIGYCLYRSAFQAAQRAYYY